MAKFAYISQTNSIDGQVSGYETKTGNKLSNTPTEGAKQGVDTPPDLQGKGKGKGKGKVKEKGKGYNKYQDDNVLKLQPEVLEVLKNAK